MAIRGSRVVGQIVLLFILFGIGSPAHPADEVIERIEEAKAAYQKGELEKALKELRSASRTISRLRAKVAAQKVNPKLGIKEVQAHPDRYKGQIVRWKGEVLSVEGDEAKTTLWIWVSEGKGLCQVVFRGSDLSLYRRGSQVELIGKVEGTASGATLLEGIFIELL